jgi:hypothetical protein
MDRFGLTKEQWEIRDELRSCFARLYADGCELPVQVRLMEASGPEASRLGLIQECQEF